MAHEIPENFLLRTSKPWHGITIPNATLIIRETSGEEHHIPLPQIERKVCQNGLIKALSTKKKK